MADIGTGPQGVANFGNGTTNPADGNNRRKALLQLLMQKAGAGGIGGQAGTAVGATPFGGLRAVPAHRDSAGQGFTRPAQVAAAFVGGLGVGSRPGSDQGGSNGAPVQRFLPSDGGPVQRHVAPPGPQSPHAPQSPQAPQLGPSDPFMSASQLDASGAPTAQADPAAIAASGDVALANGQVQSGDGTIYGASTNVDGGIRQRVGSATPTSGSSNMIPLGNGAYFDPATGTVHYPTGNSAQ